MELSAFLPVAALGRPWVMGIDDVPELRFDCETHLGSFILEISREGNKEDDDNGELSAGAEDISRFNAISARASMLEIFMVLLLS